MFRNLDAIEFMFVIALGALSLAIVTGTICLTLVTLGVINV
jgi:hypothetical protein